jgi:predicted membrane channel-forming protein YqfA (hemolysin III family)
LVENIKVHVEKLIPAGVFIIAGIFFLFLPADFLVKTPFGSTLEYGARLILGVILLIVGGLAYVWPKKKR